MLSGMYGKLFSCSGESTMKTNLLESLIRIMAQLDCLSIELKNDQEQGINRQLGEQLQFVYDALAVCLRWYVREVRDHV